MRELYKQILNHQDTRKNLITLKEKLKAPQNQIAFLYYLNGNYSGLYHLLKEDDAKIRKNAALIMGLLAQNEFLEPLFKAYQEETTLFVKADYLAAIRNLNYRSILEDLKNRLNELVSSQVDTANLKHIRSEIKVLREMILDLDKPISHTFTGYDALSNLILITNRDHKEATLEQIKNGKARPFNAGVIVCTKDLNEILNIRTYSDLLFRLQKVSLVSNNPITAAEEIAQSDLLRFLKIRHKESRPFYFRIELKSRMPLDEKSIFVKKMAAQLETLSKGQLINSTSNYEIELRLIQNKEGLFNVLVKLYTLKDERFNYRKQAVAASIQPVNAALTAYLAKDFLKPNAQVLDPFCGVGTMLIERNKIVHADPMYGIDIFREATEKAAINAQADHTIIHFINKDFFDFKHNYLFDEIFTNMPMTTARKSEEEISNLYFHFFNKALEVLKDRAIIVMYSRNPEFVKKNLNHHKAYTLLKEYSLSKKEGTYVYILQVCK